MITVYGVRISDMRDREQALLEDAGERRRETALRFLRRDDRLRSLSAGYLMKHCVPGFTEERLSFGKDGKPFLKNGVPFNLSHGGNFSVLALCADCTGIGVDIEPIREMAFYRDILPYAMTVEEQAAIGDDAEKAVQIWTRRESLYKSIGEGISNLRELPAVLTDEVEFFGERCILRSRKLEGHLLSVAVRGLFHPMNLGKIAVSICAQLHNPFRSEACAVVPD